MAAKPQTPARKSKTKTASATKAPARDPKRPSSSAQSHHLDSVWQLTATAARLLWRYKVLFGGIILIYGLLTLILVQGFTGTTAANLKTQLNQALGGHLGRFGSGLTVFVSLLGTSGNGTGNGSSAYQLFLVLVVSLALIWSMRQIYAGRTVRVRDAYYQGMYPLVPLVLVILVIGLQLLPLVIGSALYSLVITNGIAIFLIEKLAWAVGFGLLAVLSFYWVSSSLFAIYIVTLPDMTPLKALRSARELVRHRRLLVLRKLLYLPVVMFVVAAVIMVPIIIIATPLAPWVFFLLSLLAVAAAHSYAYALYRGLLND